MKGRIGILLLVLGAAVFVGFLTSCFWLPPEDYTHTGKGLFTEEQYLEFKTSMASEDIEIERIDILDNNYPILIGYKFTSKDKSPMWKEDIGTNWEGDFTWWALASMFLFIPGILLLGKEEK